MQATFYVADDIVLRTQTSGGQIRVMDKEKPPIKVLVPGRVLDVYKRQGSRRLLILWKAPARWLLSTMVPCPAMMPVS